MKRTVIVFGLLGGAVASAMMLLTLPFMDRIGFARAEVLGYTTIVAAFLLVFFGVRSYREEVAGGTITFGRAVKVGLLITLVICFCYVATWEVIYYFISPDFVDRYASYTLDTARASGATPQEIEATSRQMEEFKVMFRNPLLNAALTLLEPLPIGIVVTLISAAVLRRSHSG